MKKRRSPSFQVVERKKKARREKEARERGRERERERKKKAGDSMNAGKGPCADFGPAVIGSQRHCWQRVHLKPVQ